MIAIDQPRIIHADELTVLLTGWYGTDHPWESIAVRLGGDEFPCYLEDRHDVTRTYPSLHAYGFRCALHFLSLPEPPQCLHTNASCKLMLEFVIDGLETASIEINVEEGWLDDLMRIRNAMGDVATSGWHEELQLRSGDAHHRAYVGLPDEYDVSAASAFSLLTSLGLRQGHRLVDIGCGSLRVGRLLIVYLDKGNYLGLEPNRCLVEAGISQEIGLDLIALKRPSFVFSEQPSALKNFPPSHFALANSIFSHASLLQVREWVGAISEHLTSRGILVATFVQGKADYTGSNWIYPECIAYKRETMERVAAEAGFRFIPLDWKHLHGQTWALFAKPRFDSSWFEGRPLGWNTRAEKLR